MEFAAWVAVLALVGGFWSQIYRIHVHKEVRDLSIASYTLLAVGYCILAFQAYNESTTIFLVKNILTLIPVCIIVAQIRLHKEDHWHDDQDPICTNKTCSLEQELDWTFCPYCGNCNEQLIK